MRPARDRNNGPRGVASRPDRPAASAVVPSAPPLTRLRQIAGELARFADVLEAETDFDSRAFRHWHAQLLDIADELEAARGNGDRL